jgi:hypothetical protein
MMMAASRLFVLEKLCHLIAHALQTGTRNYAIYVS